MKFHDYDPWDLLLQICEHQQQQAQQIVNLNTALTEKSVTIDMLKKNQRQILDKITALNQRIQELTVNKQKDQIND